MQLRNLFYYILPTFIKFETIQPTVDNHQRCYAFSIGFCWECAPENTLKSITEVTSDDDITTNSTIAEEYISDADWL